MRNERLKNYQEYLIKKDRGRTTLLKIIINMSMHILRATKLKYGAIHYADPKPMCLLVGMDLYGVNGFSYKF